MKLLPYDFIIEFKPGLANSSAYTLSRQPQQADLLALTFPMANDFHDWSKALTMDPFTNQILHGKRTDPTLYHNFELLGNILFFHNRVIVLVGEQLQLKILYEAHNTPATSHGEFLKTLK